MVHSIPLFFHISLQSPSFLRPISRSLLHNSCISPQNSCPFIKTCPFHLNIFHCNILHVNLSDTITPYIHLTILISANWCYSAHINVLVNQLHKSWSCKINIISAIVVSINGMNYSYKLTCWRMDLSMTTLETTLTRISFNSCNFR